MKTIKALLFAILLMGCNSNSAPKCSDEKVTQKVIDMIADRINDELKGKTSSWHFNLSELRNNIDNIVTKEMPNRGWSERVITFGDRSYSMEDYWKDINVLERVYDTDKADYEKERSRLEDENKKYLKDKEIVKSMLVDSLVKELKSDIHLENIRIENTNDKIKKCDCQADLFVEKNEIETLSFSAQYTEEGKIYIFVSGL